MSDALNSIFAPFASADDPVATLRLALEIVDAFADRFNSRDTSGMDALLHFPHVILAGDRLIVWDEPGQLVPAFFEELLASGWAKSVYLEKRAVLISAQKVHLVVTYTRNRADESVISRHDNLWIITSQDGKWGIKERSY